MLRTTTGIKEGALFMDFSWLWYFLGPPVQGGVLKTFVFCGLCTAEPKKSRGGEHTYVSSWLHCLTRQTCVCSMRALMGPIRPQQGRFQNWISSPCLIGRDCDRNTGNKAQGWITVTSLPAPVGAPSRRPCSACSPVSPRDLYAWLKN